MSTLRFMLAGVPVLLGVVRSLADWPTLHHDAGHSGFVEAQVSPPYHLAWARYFEQERLGTAMEPIVAGHTVFAATHSGSLYALDADRGQPRWRFQAPGAFLQSPAFDSGLVVAGDSDGRLYALEGETGALRWSGETEPGGFSASPAIVGGTIFIGSRAGDFLAVTLADGQVRWRRSLKAPLRQTAAVAQGRVFITAEDLRVHCFEVATGVEVWASEPLTGQSARDYYPMVVEVGGRAWVIVRTNPILSMGHQIARDRQVLCRSAGVDDSSWQKLDAWIKSAQADGTPQLREQEQQVISDYLGKNRAARTFFVLEAATGQEALTAPVLWVAGCQGVGAMPALTDQGRLLVLHRSAYGNWNHGVAPLVALGMFDPTQNRITPLQHQFGRQPAWNTFWGTADESQNFTVAGHTILIVHQGTLSGFDLQSNRLFPIWGERDTFGGFRSPPWARNEWHGPARGSVAMVDNKIFWLTGSRILCLAPGMAVQPALEELTKGATVPTVKAPAMRPPSADWLQQRLWESAREFLSRRWAPLYVEPGLAGRDFSFDQSGEVFESLAWSYPHLSRPLQQQTQKFLAEEWSRHPPITKEAWYALSEGARREWVWVPGEALSRWGQDPTPHPFGNVYAVWLYAERCGEWTRVLDAWPQIHSSFEAFVRSGWRLDGKKGDLFANRYLASLQAFARLAVKAGQAEAAVRAESLARETGNTLVSWWQRAAEQGTLGQFKGSAELDPFIGRGDGISFRVAPHRHKVALLRDLTPEVAQWLLGQAPEAVTRIWATFETLYRTWALTGEERQVHSGENFVDPPDLALGGFKALAWLQGASFPELARRVDLPFCRADLDYLVKLALCLEAAPIRQPQ